MIHSVISLFFRLVKQWRLVLVKRIDHTYMYMRINAKRRVVDKYVSCLQTYKIFGQDILTALENQTHGHHAKQVNI